MNTIVLFLCRMSMTESEPVLLVLISWPCFQSGDGMFINLRHLIHPFSKWILIFIHIHHRGAVRHLPDHADAVGVRWRMRFNGSNVKWPVILQPMCSAIRVPFVRRLVKFVAGFLIPASMLNQSCSWFLLGVRPWAVELSYHCFYMLSSHLSSAYTISVAEVNF